jgi:hypothetical protein
MSVLLCVQFAEMHRKQGGTGLLLTTAQEEWLTIQRMLADVTLKVLQH